MSEKTIPKTISGSVSGIEGQKDEPKSTSSRRLIEFSQFVPGLPRMRRAVQQAERKGESIPGAFIRKSSTRPSINLRV